MNNKRLLGEVFALNLKAEAATSARVSKDLSMERPDTRRKLEGLRDSGFLSEKKGTFALTTKGRKAIRVVFIGGGFELIHYGHVHTISRAKALGDVLVVSIARDSTIRKRKNREPLVGEEERARLVSSLREVDAAILGVEGDIYVTLEKVKPDIVALGYDQYHLEDDIVREAKKRGMDLRVVRLDTNYPDVKTSRILKEF